MTAPRNAISADLAAYCDALNYAPGDTVAVHAHGDRTTRIDIVRLAAPYGDADHADEQVPGIDPLERLLTGQTSHPGSFAVVERFAMDQTEPSLTLSVWIWPTRLDARAAQGVVAVASGDGTGFALAVVEGCVALVSTGSNPVELARIATPLMERQWTRVVATLDTAAQTCTLTQTPKLPFPDGLGSGAATGRLSVVALSIACVVIGACVRVSPPGRAPYGVDCFNGKIEAVRIEGTSGARLAEWDFSQGIATDRIHDVSGHHRDGRLINAPTRAVTGHAWSGDEVDFRLLPAEYAAIHFHDDDLEDAGWDEVARIDLPTALKSGAYAVRLRSGAAEDHVPFFVTPPAPGPRAPVAFLASTFNYLAYANAGLHDRFDYAATGMTGRTLRPGERDRQRRAHPAMGGSLYDLHSDGSGRSTSSLLRPIFTIRADYESALQHAPRHIGADLFTLDWLRRRGFSHDVLTDHWLDEEEADLTGYRVLITSSHPEYWSARMLSHLEAFIAGGGRVMYLGGNGFYWVTARDRQRPHLIECRRGQVGVRAWSSEPGENHLSTTGEQGGLWRLRGRAPNRLVGIGMAAQGTDLKSPGYAITDAGREPANVWIFEGTTGDIFGEAGYAMGGAAGDEVDRYDLLLGSPPHAQVVASSLKLGRYYKVAVEDVEMIADDLDGASDPRVRADVVLFDWAGGARVFSTGSIAWAAAMGWNDFDNDVERITRNVLNRFLEV